MPTLQDLVNARQSYSPYANTPYTPQRQQEGIMGVDPDYDYMREEAMRGLTSQNSARGLMYSGADIRQRNRMAQGMASNQFQTQFNRLAQLAGLGQFASTMDNTGYGRGIGNAMQAAGDLRGSGYAQSANAWGNGLQQLGSIYGNQTAPTAAGIMPGEWDWMYGK